MGQQLTTPLSLTLGHWQDVLSRARKESVEIRKKKWRTLCFSEWPALNTGWPRDGTFDLTTILQVKTRVFQPGPWGYPDQVPYIVTWESLSRDPPPWVRPFLPPRLSGPCPTPLPLPAPLIPTPSAPPSTSSLLPLTEPRSPNPRPKAPAVLPNTQEDLLLLDSPPPYPNAEQAASQLPAADQSPPPPSSTTGDPGDPSPPSTRLRSRRDKTLEGPDSSGISQAFPLRSMGEGRYQYWPFSSADLYNWKAHNPPFSQDPQALTGLIESILITHQPTWDDCQQLLGILLTTEERQRVLLEARKNVPGPDGRPTQLPNEIDEVFPLIRPTDWDINTAAGRERHRLYRQTLLAGLKGAGRRPTNLAKVRAVVQGLEETPAGFLERLMEAYRMYTPFDPQAQDREADIIMSFIGQSAPDIRTKLQRLEGLQGYTLRDLVKEAEKIFNKRETPEEKEERLRKLQEDRENVRDKKQNQELAKILATVVQGSKHRPGQTGNLGDKRRTRVERNQCAYCKEKGHWVKHCPKNPRRKPTPILPLEKGD
ncbi:Gag polyprotein [Cricetulus griseus]|uniref:Gag polyprotein n=1 Tax=Cricetulus griseus TaxID=10029 RepID=G3GSE2_CRIGR|nr:Gag polyprotein [Cricetulus griseus]QPP11374.1 gag polyprotein [Cricetulus griseus]